MAGASHTIYLLGQGGGHWLVFNEHTFRCRTLQQTTLQAHRAHTPPHLSYSTCPPSGTQKATPTLPCHPTLGAPPLPVRPETPPVIVPPPVDRLYRHAMAQQDELVIMTALLNRPLATPLSLAIPRLTRLLVGQSLFLGLIISRLERLFRFVATIPRTMLTATGCLEGSSAPSLNPVLSEETAGAMSSPTRTRILKITRKRLSLPGSTKFRKSHLRGLPLPAPTNQLKRAPTPLQFRV